MERRLWKFVSCQSTYSVNSWAAASADDIQTSCHRIALSVNRRLVSLLGNSAYRSINDREREREREIFAVCNTIQWNAIQRRTAGYQWVRRKPMKCWPVAALLTSAHTHTHTHRELRRLKFYSVSQVDIMRCCCLTCALNALYCEVFVLVFCYSTSILLWILLVTN